MMKFLVFIACSLVWSSDFSGKGFDSWLLTIGGCSTSGQIVRFLPSKFGSAQWWFHIQIDQRSQPTRRGTELDSEVL